MRLFDAGARGREPARVHNGVLTVANAITAARLLGLPVFAWLVVGPGHYLRAFWVLAAVAATDWVDGYVARRFDQVTRIGQLLDPFIDRLLLATAAVCLLAAQLVPWWLALLVVGRDAVLLAGAAVVARGRPLVAVNRTGKFATACLLAGLPGFLLGHAHWPGAEAALAAAWVLTGAGVTAYYVAGIRYARQTLRELAG